MFQTLNVIAVGSHKINLHFCSLCNTIDMFNVCTKSIWVQSVSHVLILLSILSKHDFMVKIKNVEHEIR